MKYRKVLAFIITLVLVVSLLVAVYLMLTPAKIGEKHVIGLIRLKGAILFDSDANRYLNIIEHSSIRAVVIW